MISTVASHLARVCTRSLRGFSPRRALSVVRLIGNSILSIGVNVGLSLCFSPVTDWRPSRV